MTDDELDQLLSSRMDEGAAARAILEIATRLTSNTRLTADSLTALVRALVHVIEGETSAKFLAAGARGRGRPKGAGKQVSFVRGLTDAGAALGYLPKERAALGDRSLQRMRAKLRGPGKPGRPKKSDK